MTYYAYGKWKDSSGRRHNFTIESDRAETRFIKELVAAQYPCYENDVTVNGVNGKARYGYKQERFSGYNQQPITNSTPTDVTSGTVGVNDEEYSSGGSNFEQGDATGLAALLGIAVGGIFVYQLLPVIALVGAGGLAFKETKKRTSGVQWLKRTGIMLLTTGVASMVSFYGTSGVKSNVDAALYEWWYETPAQVSN
jgi:hypothetical protein